MRILQVITSLSIGGAENLVVELTRGLRFQGIDVDVAVLRKVNSHLVDRLSEVGCEVISLSENDSVYNPCHIIRLRRIIRNYDIIHTHNTSPQFFVAVASLGMNVRLVTTEHSTNNRRRKYTFFRWIDRWMYRRYERVVSISGIAERNLTSYLHMSGDRFVTIHNGIDIRKFANAQPNPSLKNGSKRFVVTMVAGFRYEKDQDTIVHAISLLPEDTYELWLVGDGSRRKELESLIQELGVGDQVILWGIRSDIPQILKTSDVIVMSSHFEGLSLSCLEGMSAGKPFLASNVDGLREIIQNSGLMFEHENYHQLAGMIKELFEDRNLYAKIADACSLKASDYEISKTIEQYKNLYWDEYEYIPGCSHL